MTNMTTTTNKSIGALLGVMCGDVLGASVEGWSSPRICQTFPEGLVHFQPSVRGYGMYTDDTQMTLALAQSIIEKGGRVDPDHIAWAYASQCQAHRGYGASTLYLLQHLEKTRGKDWRHLVSLYKPGGGSDKNGAAMRIAPIGIAYRNATSRTLFHQAVTNTCIMTHTHPTAIDAAFILATTIKWCMQKDPRTLSLHDVRFLLTNLRDLARTPNMQNKLARLADKFRCIASEPARNPRFWKNYLASQDWKLEYALQFDVCDRCEFQIEGDKAVAAALCAFVHHGMLGRRPENAIIAACHYGGDTDTVASMAGACVGALHGYEVLPARWINHLENAHMGRDCAVDMARQLTHLSVQV